MAVGHDRSVSGKYFASNTLSQPAREITEINEEDMITAIIQSPSTSSAHHPPPAVTQEIYFPQTGVDLLSLETGIIIFKSFYLSAVMATLCL